MRGYLCLRRGFVSATATSDAAHENPSVYLCLPVLCREDKTQVTPNRKELSMSIPKPTAAELRAEIERVERESREELRHLRALLRVTEDRERKTKPEA